MISSNCRIFIFLIRTTALLSKISLASQGFIAVIFFFYVQILSEEIKTHRKSINILERLKMVIYNALKQPQLAESVFSKMLQWKNNFQFYNFLQMDPLFDDDFLNEVKQVSAKHKEAKVSRKGNKFDSATHQMQKVEKGQKKQVKKIRESFNSEKSSEESK